MLIFVDVVLNIYFDFVVLYFGPNLVLFLIFTFFFQDSEKLIGYKS